MLGQFDIKETLEEALFELYRNDYLLIKNKCCERSIVFRLGLYLANSLAVYELDVDCEYNKNGEKPKSLGNKRFNYPDIIVHKRGSNENNILIAEVKTPRDTRPKDFHNDTVKLKGFTQEVAYLYRWGVHIYISATTCSLVWYTHEGTQEVCKYKIEPGNHNLSSNSRKDNALDRWYKQLLPIYMR